MKKREVDELPSTQVVIAALNEEEGIGKTIAELCAYLKKPSILVVDGRSSDRTVEIAKDMGADIAFQNGLGKGDALAKAFEHSKLTMDYIVIIDADYTYPAQYIPQMVRILEENPNVGMVLGNRFNGHLDHKALPGVLYFGNRLVSLTHNLLNDTYLDDPLSGLRVVRAEILKHWDVKSKGFDIEVELNHHVEQKGLGIIEIPIHYRQRLGEKKLKTKHGAAILKRMVIEHLITSGFRLRSLNEKLRTLNERLSH